MRRSPTARARSLARETRAGASYAVTRWTRTCCAPSMQRRFFRALNLNHLHLLHPITSPSPLSPHTQMAYPPKTPTRHGRSRSETKTPLSSSFFSTNNLADASNPFIVPSRPASRAASPVKKSSTQMQATLKKQASVGLIRKGGVESRLDVVTRDYVPPPPKSEKRSRSQPSVSSALKFMPRSCFLRGV